MQHPHAGSSSTNSSGVNETGVTPPYGTAPSLTDWASPDEVLKMRTLWSDIELHHKAETAQLREQVKIVAKERDGLLKEVKEYERMKDLFAAARMEYDKLREEREQWKEEREAMILRMQQLSNEAALAGANRGHSGSSSATASTSSGSRSVTTDTAMRRDLIDMLEQLHRKDCELAEIHRRLDAESVIWNATFSRVQRLQCTKIHECELMRARVAAVEQQAATAASEARRFKEETQTQQIRAQVAEQASQSRVAEVKVEMKAAAEAAEQRHAEVVESLERKILDLERNVTAITEECAVSKNAAHLAWDRSVAVLRDEIASNSKNAAELEKELREVQAKSEAASRKYHDDLRAKEQQCTQLREALSEASAAQRESGEACKTLQARVDMLSQEVCVKTTELQKSVCEIGRLTALVDATQQQLEGLRNMKGERDAFKLRLEVLEQEAQHAAESYERQIKVSATALEVLQKKHREATQWMASELELRETRKYRRHHQSADIHNVPDSIVQKSATVSPTAAAPKQDPECKNALLDSLRILQDTAEAASAVTAAICRQSAT